MSSTCPVCGAEQTQGLLCHADTSRLERNLAAVAAIIEDLDISLSKQARIGMLGRSGLARERMPINLGAIDSRWVLTNVLTSWATDVSGGNWQPRRADTLTYRNPHSQQHGPLCPDCRHPSCAAMRMYNFRPALPVERQAAAYLLNSIPRIRRHPAVDKLVDEITDAVHQARRTVDRPADLTYLGQCYMETPDPDGRMVTCLNEIYGAPSATQVQCKVCGTEHPVAERRHLLLRRAENIVMSVKDASLLVGEIGGIKVSQASIRGYLHRGKIAYRPEVPNGIRLGDLLAVVLDQGERATA